MIRRSSGLQGRADAAEYEDAGFSRAVKRYERAVLRFQELTGTVPDRVLRNELARLGETLESCLSDLQSVRRNGIRQGREDMLRHAAHRCATLCSHAIEAALMAAERSRQREFDDVVRCVDTVRTLTKAIRELADFCMVER